MKLFRIKNIVTVFSLFTSVIFLNLSFMLAEIAALKMDQNKQVAQYLSILIASSMAEEEPGSGDADATFAEIDLIVQHVITPSVGAVTSDIKFNIWSHGHPRLGEFEINNPPPEA